MYSVWVNADMLIHNHVAITLEHTEANLGRQVCDLGVQGGGS